MKRQSRAYYDSGITRFEEPRRRPTLARLAVLAAVVLLLLWVLIPAVRVGLLLATDPLRQTSGPPAGLPAQQIHFRATDGVRLRGWFVPASARAACIVLVPGFKADAASMAPYARFLHASGYNLLLYDSRGTGGSGGSFALGLGEVNDVRGAIAYLQRRPQLLRHRYGLLGVSLGAGVAIVAAARLPQVAATVADSAYVDQRAEVRRLDSLRLGSITVPLAPLAEPLVDRILGARLASFSPLQSIAHIAPRAVLLIHSRHDRNPTTPLSGAMKLYHAAGRNTFLWIAPRGGHAGALAAQGATYERHVVSFFRRYLGK